MDKMKAVRIHAYGGPERLVVDELARPVPGAGELLVEAKASGVNPVDLKIRRGELADVLPALPVTIGSELAGTVAAVGAGVEGFAIGDAVFAMQPVGSVGTHTAAVVLPAGQVAPKPPRLSFEEAAAVPVSALAAWTVREAGRPAAGERVLVLGAGGAVGHSLLQLLTETGAHVVATASAGDLDRVRRLGAAEAYDYRKPGEFASVDLVIDLAGGDARRDAWRHLGPDGRMVSLVPPPAPGPDGRLAQLVFTPPDGALLARLGALIEAGTLAPLPVAAVRPLDEVAQVHAEIEAGRLRGKIVLKT
jgi:NADPH:quinone reductase-like Zn-dependent oxidoreductase